MKKTYFRALTIAGSDSGGGAGIQADLKTFAALGCYGMSVITALTAQNTKEVRSIYDVSPRFIREQIDAVLSDIGADAVKIGMLHSPGVIKVVSDALREYKPRFIVLDPVMVAKGGEKLLKDDAIEILKDELMPLCHVITPNLPELCELTGERPAGDNELLNAALGLQRQGARWIVIKGGHIPGPLVSDLLITPEGHTVRIESPRINTPNVHGTGCTFSSAIAAFLAMGSPVEDAFKKAKHYLSCAIKYGSEYKTGSGHGPVCHAYAMLSDRMAANPK